MKVSRDNLSVTIGSVSKVTGDVTVSQRKGRLRHNFDLNISFDWDSNTDESGQVEIRDFMSDTDEKGFEFYVKAKENSPSISSSTKSFILSALKDSVWITLQEFSKDLIDEHGKHLIITNDSSTEPNFEAKETIDAFKRQNSSTGEKLVCRETGMLEETVNFNVPVEQIMAALTKPECIRSWARSTVGAPLDTPGSKFSLFSGAVQGEMVKIDREGDSVKIEMNWKLASWPSFSQVSLHLTNDGRDGCNLMMKQTGVPLDQLEIVNVNWENYYWNSIKALFGSL